MFNAEFHTLEKKHAIKTFDIGEKQLWLVLLIFFLANQEIRFYIFSYPKIIWLVGNLNLTNDIRNTHKVDFLSSSAQQGQCGLSVDSHLHIMLEHSVRSRFNLLQIWREIYIPFALKKSLTPGRGAKLNHLLIHDSSMLKCVCRHLSLTYVVWGMLSNS